jgi:hypothetical protein
MTWLNGRENNTRFFEIQENTEQKAIKHRGNYST